MGTTSLVAGMIDTDVAIAEIDQAVVAAPAIGVDDGARVDPAADNTLDDAEQGALGFTGQQHAFPHAPVEPVHGVAVQPTQRRRLQCRQIGGDVAHDLADLASEILERFAYLFLVAMLSFMPHSERLS